MEELKKSEEVLAEVHRNCLLAIQSITNILPEADDAQVREELLKQHEEYERIGAKAALIAKNKDIELKNPSPIKKAMMWTSIKMGTMKDDSRSHIAKMMVQGTVTGITALKTSLGQMGESSPDSDIKALAEELLHAEEGFEKNWKCLIA